MADETVIVDKIGTIFLGGPPLVKVIIIIIIIIIIMIMIIFINIKSLFNTHKKELCTVLHLKGIKTKFVP